MSNSATQQVSTDADLAYAWGYREGFRAFVGLDVPMSSEQIFQSVQEQWREEMGEALGLSARLEPAQRAGMGVLDRLGR